MRSTKPDSYVPLDQGWVLALVSVGRGGEVLPGPCLGDGFWFWCGASRRGVESVVQRGRGGGHGRRLLTDGLLHLSPGVKPRCYHTGAVSSRTHSVLYIDMGKKPCHTFFPYTKCIDS